MGKVLGNLRLTAMIAGMAIGAVAIAIVAVLIGLMISLSASVSADAEKEIAGTTRISAAILQVNLPSLEVASAENGDVTGLTMRSMPRFRSHGVIDTIAQVTGENAAIYVYDAEAGPDLTLGTSSFVLVDGERRLDDPILSDTSLFASLAANQAVRSEVSIDGVDYFLAYQPIVTANGAMIGALMIAVERGPIEAVIGRSLNMLLAVGGAVMLVIGALVLLLSRRLTTPIPRLSATMSEIAAGQLDASVPYTERRNEIGAMARAVEVFRTNALRIAELGRETESHLVAAADHNGQLSAISMSQLVIEFSLTGEVLSANANLLDLLGYRGDEVVGQPNALFLFDADPTSTTYRQFWLDLAAGAFKAGEYRRQTRDGREVWIQSTFNPILGLDGVPYKVVQFATDVTARRQAVAAVGEGLARLAEGDLSASIDTPFQPAFEDLRHALNGTAARFSDVVGQLQDTARALRLATGEILSGANDLSERTTKQAATIEQTAAAMETLAGTVTGNARMARDAAGKAKAVASSVADSGTVMSQANAAMERITTSSSKISNIIGMIDDIAFQTNLLALNASVEAARAGDAGKGFAVVAVEVRRLAQSAAGASADVKALVEQSASEVKSGSGLVSNAAGRLHAMLEAVRANSELVEAIALASGEQAASIEEVSTAVRTLDEMTQHNAALVEEINAALEQTEAQAQSLDGLVDVFTLAESADQSSGRRAA